MRTKLEASHIPFRKAHDKKDFPTSVEETEPNRFYTKQREQPSLKHVRVHRFPSWLLTTLGLLFVLLVWIYLSNPNASQYGLVPTPQDTLLSLFNLLGQGSFWNNLSVTLYRMLLGFGVSVVAGVPLGVGIGLSRSLSAMFGGPIDSLKYTPVSAFIPLSIILFGVGDEQKVAILLLATGPYMAVMTADAVRSTRAEYIEGALTLGASRRQVIVHVILASVAPQIWQAARIALAIAWTYIITAELVGSESGLGRFLLLAERFFNIREMFDTIIIIAVIGWICDLGFRFFYRRCFRWAVLMSRERNSYD